MSDFRDDFYGQVRERLPSIGAETVERLADIAAEVIAPELEAGQMDEKRAEYAVTDAEDLAIAAAVSAIDSVGGAAAAYLRGYMDQKLSLGHIVAARHAACAWHAFYESALHLVLRPGEAFPVGIGEPNEQPPVDDVTQ
jgi:hypothetical protein